MKEFYYIVFEDLTVHMVDKIDLNEEGVDDSAMVIYPLFYIKSEFIRTSRGKRLYDYYKNIFYDAKLNRIKNNSLKFNGITCNIVEDESWREYEKNKHSVTLTTKVIDKLGVEVEKIVDHHRVPENRFRTLFNYKDLIIVRLGKKNGNAD